MHKDQRNSVSNGPEEEVGASDWNDRHVVLPWFGIVRVLSFWLHPADPFSGRFDLIRLPSTHLKSNTQAIWCICAFFHYTW